VKTKLPVGSKLVEALVARHRIILLVEMSDKNKEQRINIAFCVKIIISASEMLALLTLVCGEYYMKKSRAFEWHRQFKGGREAVQDDPTEWAAKNAKHICICGQSTNFSKLRRLGVNLITE
jgi:hypothetical protein